MRVGFIENISRCCVYEGKANGYNRGFLGYSYLRLKISE